MKKRQVKAPVIEEEEKILGDNDTEEVFHDILGAIFEILVITCFLCADSRLH